MRKFGRKKWCLMTVLGLVAGFGILTGVLNGAAQAEEESSEGETNGNISISISPVTESFNSLKSNETYDGVMKVTNSGSVPFDFEVYSAPYSIANGDGEGEYQPSFSTENSYTQITRWITIRDQSGNYVSSIESSDASGGSHPTFSTAPGETVEVAYRIQTPDNIPSGGQYAVLMARTLPKASETSGINAVAALAMKVFGRSQEGEAIQSAEISDMWIKRSLTEEAEVEENGTTVTKDVTVGHVNGHALVKNTGNLDFTATGVLTVTSIFGGEPYYQTPGGKAAVSIIPDSQLVVADEWEDTPSFGLYKVNWTVTAGSDKQTTEMVICLIPPFVIIIAIIFLTIIIASVIMAVRRRKERRSRFSI